jgi:RNA polymerase sigma factor (sigma-70 family)
MEPEQTIESRYEEHRERLVGFCFRMVGERETAEDIAQDVFVTSVTQKKADSAWLYACARNRCIDHLRRRSGWQRVTDSLRQTLGWIPGFESEWVDRDLGFAILRGLSPKLRSLLLLKVYAGLDYKELAEIFDTTPETVGVLLSRARKKAREQWKKDQ